MQIHNVKQRSDEWFRLRAENPFSASIILTVAVAGEGLTSLIREKLEEKYFGVKKHFSNENTIRGNEQEKLAIKELEKMLNVEVEDIGFITDVEISEMAGASPDGYVKKINAGVEIKCPAEKTFNIFVKTGKVKKSYYYQMQAQIMFGKYDFVFYGVYYDGILIIKKILSDKEVQKKIKIGLSIAVDRYKVMERRFIKENNI